MKTIHALAIIAPLSLLIYGIFILAIYEMYKSIIISLLSLL